MMGMIYHLVAFFRVPLLMILKLGAGLFFLGTLACCCCLPFDDVHHTVRKLIGFGLVVSLTCHVLTIWINKIYVKAFQAATSGGGVVTR